MAVFYAEVIEMFLMGLLFPLGILFIAVGNLPTGLTLIIAVGITYYFKRRRENAVRNKNNSKD